MQEGAEPLVQQLGDMGECCKLPHPPPQKTAQGSNDFFQSLLQTLYIKLKGVPQKNWGG